MTWMRQKSEPERSSTPPSTSPPKPKAAQQTTPQAPAPTPAPQAQAAPSPRSTPVVNVGESVRIKGELTGNEDLVIEGRVEGQIRLPKHKLTIGASAKIEAEVSAKTVIVLGEVHGNITAEDQVTISESGSVNGDIAAPRVSIADGARFNGGIDMLERTASLGTTPQRNERGETPEKRTDKEMAMAG